MKTYQRRKLMVVLFGCVIFLIFLLFRLGYLMVLGSGYYEKKAQTLHERERYIKAPRGKIYDRNGILLADNQTVCTVSVIHNQVEQPQRVAKMLAKELQLPFTEVKKRVNKVTAIEKIKANVSKATGDRILAYGLAGVKVDEDRKRFYPHGKLASKVLGFAGGENQGILGLEVQYEKQLKGKDGCILTLTDARGMELENAPKRRIAPIPGKNLYTTLDYTIQYYCQQAAEKICKEKKAKHVSILVMNPQNGEILAMVDVPEYNLNRPFSKHLSMKQLNERWRNGCIHDTYEPGSIFKIITSCAGLEAGVVTVSDRFFCPGFKVVEDRRIHCHKVKGHGALDFTGGLMNSCNPVFIEVGLRLGVEKYFRYFEQFGLYGKTGIDLPGEAKTIMHDKKNVGPVELATISFGQSFQITPIKLATSVSSLLNGGTMVTPHIGRYIVTESGKKIRKNYPAGKRIVSRRTSRIMRKLLRKVVAEGTGNKAEVEGYSVGGKTATSQTLPRSAHKYISSFLGFEPAKHPTVLALITIKEPKGIYYGGTIAAPVIRNIFENILPYLHNR
ncbi:stage V sporulation protein D (sporulation-specific penicillin-binding protein) [Lachnospiraceae bacterium XBB1006]|nr:stage V sporulation protein D (sporulation-specific penicillin-binding protein) [Lachnospiraceae bacterium XBB1006]